MMENNAVSQLNSGLGRRMSFIDLVKEYVIVIPVIQRDYVQGRQTEKIAEIRKNFVSDLISFIGDENKKSHDLDAIYGSVQSGQFVPLDGQQRLTTLFLLHLYVAGMNDGNSFLTLKYILCGRFSYMTRHSSAMFCEKLIDNNVFEEYKNRKDENQTLSDVIRNQGWFYDVWQQDPTVAGMLVMLDAIDEGFRKSGRVSVESAYSRLFADTPQPITFLMLPLNGYSRRDDLYIKMNARGVHLTEFETFKAKFGSFVGDVAPEKKKELMLKLDVSWVEYLWKYRGNSDNVDCIMERIIRFVIGCSCSFNGRRGSDTTIGGIMDYLLEQNDKTMRFTFSRYCELGVFHGCGCEIDDRQAESERRIVDTLIDFFDVLCSDEYSPLASDKYGRADISRSAKDLFLSGGLLQYSSRLRLYAYLKYICAHKSQIDEDDLSQWTRVICNLDEATPINNSYEFYRACRAVDSILEQISSSKVLEWLCLKKESAGVSWFRTYQFAEEIIKAELLLWDNGECAKRKDMETLIYKCESNHYMRGQIGFLLHFSGLWETENNPDISNLQTSQFDDYYSSLKTYADKAIALFEVFKKDGDYQVVVNECLLERALLAKGFYLKQTTAGRWNFCNNPWSRDFSWKSMLIFNSASNDNRYSLSCFKDVLDDMNVSDIEGSLRRIISSAADDGTFVSIIRSNPELIRYCYQGFVTLDGNYIPDAAQSGCVNVILLRQSRINHYHAELFSRDLYDRLLEKYPFIHYEEVRRWDDDNAVYFAFVEGEHRYRFNLSHWNSKWSYVVEKDGDFEDDVPQVIKDRFSSLGAISDGRELFEAAVRMVGDRICR